MKYDKQRFSHLLPSVQKPARYIDQELNSFGKIPSHETINFCMAFPDVYEVGFSHLGLKILYSVLNHEEDTVADRVYCPNPDFAELLLREELPLFGLESKVALKDFDVLGFTLQSELTFTNILYMLDLSQIPLRSADRSESDPLIIGGGPCAANPMPLSIFFDAFLIGDGEEAIMEIKNCLKLNRNRTRKEKLTELQKIAGMFIPTSLNNQKPVKIRKFQDFDDISKTHTDQIIPWLQPIHYRYVSEIMRGCSRGCRFCFAGYFYRPVRERSPKIVLENLLKEMKDYGWSEAALISLSSSDYSCIRFLLQEIYQNLDKASLSLPSLRVDSIDHELTTLMNAMHQTGLTIAPEAGSQRLRDIINKNISEEEILQSIVIALKNKWQVIKLYFMIGLPMETDEDIGALIDLIFKIIDLAGKKLQLNITISPFVPKPFTPFQWAQMADRDDLIKKAVWIKNAFSRFRFIKVKYHEIDSSLLECVIGRGDEQVGELILKAYQNGAKFDSWSEYFNFSFWQDAAAELNLKWDNYTSAIPLESDLNWQKIDLGISVEFLKKEWQRAMAGQVLTDCRQTSCTCCGICDSNLKPIYVQSTPVSKTISSTSLPDHRANIFYRAFYSKMGDMSFVTNLDLIRMFYNVFRSSDLPIVYSKGYNIHPQISFGPPLSLGVQGRNEYFDFILKELTDTEYLFEKLHQRLPVSLELKDIVLLTDKSMRAMDYYEFEEITIIPPAEFEEVFQANTASFLQCDEFPFTRYRKGKEQFGDLRKLVKEIEWNGTKLRIIKTIKNVNIFDLLDKIYKIERSQTNRFEIIRERLLPTYVR
jgi:radical SAM family uncharacterized protein/radical SAM-linked protein